MNVVIDTHTAIWYATDASRLSARAVHAIDAARRSGSRCRFSVVSLIEIVYLVEKARISPQVSAEVLKLCDGPNAPLEVASVDRAVADNAPRIPRVVVPNLQDRIIAATALHLGLPLVTADQRIRSSSVPTIW